MRYRRVFMPGATYFLTLVTHERAPILADAGAVELYRWAVARAQALRPFTIEAEAVLPDHLHMLWTLPDDDADDPTRVRFLKTAFTHAFLRCHPPGERSGSRLRKREQALWQRRYWEHAIRDERDFQAHLDYIHINPVKHGLVAAAGDWPHSTFRSWQERGAYAAGWGSDAMPPLPAWVGRE